MEKAKGLIGLVVGALLTSGCDNSEESFKYANNPSQRWKDKINYQEIRGVPVSVAESSGRFSGAVAIVLDMEGRKVLAYASSKKKLANAESVALIESEIYDGDEEPIKLMGMYDGNRFKVAIVDVQGYKVDFRSMSEGTPYFAAPSND